MNDQQKKRLKKFIAALRSGTYRQGKNSLHIKSADGSSDTFCCLGVACQVALKNRVKLNVHEGFATVDYDGQDGYLPDKLVDYYGLVHNDPVIVDADGSRMTATTANDSNDYDFNTIADMFERTYLDEGDINVAT